jgi:hypothetical protein
LPSGKQPVDDHEVEPRSNDLYRRAIVAPWWNALRYAVSGLAFALVFAGAAHFVYPHGLGLPGFLLAVWIYVWPFFLALPLIVPVSHQQFLLPRGFLAIGTAAPGAGW